MDAGTAARAFRKTARVRREQMRVTIALSARENIGAFRSVRELMSIATSRRSELGISCRSDSSLPAADSNDCLKC